MKYDVFFRRVLDGRAREHVDMREYVSAGRVEADSLREAERAARSREDNDRAIQVGDLLRDEHGGTWIYTVYGAWSKVKVIRRET